MRPWLLFILSMLRNNLCSRWKSLTCVMKCARYVSFRQWKLHHDSLNSLPLRFTTRNGWDSIGQKAWNDCAHRGVSRLCFWLSPKLKLAHKFSILHETKLINLLFSSVCRACLCWFEHKKPLKYNNNFLSLCLSWIIAADLWRSPNVRAWWPLT